MAPDRIDTERRDAEENAAKVASVAPADSLSPADRYQELFVAVQSARVYADSKTFVDCAPKRDPADILEAYRATRESPEFDLHAFVHANFVPELPPPNGYVSDPERSLVEHIDGLWDVLTRHPRTHPVRSSLLPLPNPYVVPGGRFGELYYWDSYFTMLGLAESGRPHLLRAMGDNFAYLIDTYGHIPNGNRSYYLSRSQPPVFALMTGLFEVHGICRAVQYLPQLRKEYAFWTDGAADLRRGEAHRHCVRMPDDALLNRYWDDRDTPREEAYLEDVTTAHGCDRPAHEVWRELRAGAGSGWDFSSRWCGEGGGLGSIRTTAILPVDLNSLLHTLEAQIAELAAASGDTATAAEFQRHAAARQAAINRWLWHEAAGAYLDYDWQLGQPRTLCAATTAPLYAGLANERQAWLVAATVRAQLLAPGGLATTLVPTGEQWDQPNGWAPLQWLAIRGLARYGEVALANEIGRRWLCTVAGLYERKSKLVEKYDLRALPDGTPHGGGGGEYPLQDGFGWTNGVTRKLLHDDPASPHRQARAGRRQSRLVLR